MSKKKRPKPVTTPSEGGPSEAVQVPLEWHFPEDLASRYSNQVLVQFGQYECNISFFDIKPPVVVGTPDEQRELVKNLKAVRAECVARIVVSLEFFPTVVKTLQETLGKHLEKMSQAKAAEAAETADGAQNGKEEDE
jgi:hypothetical protein